MQYQFKDRKFGLSLILTRWCRLSALQIEMQPRPIKAIGKVPQQSKRSNKTCITYILQTIKGFMTITAAPNFNIYVDIDDTLVRSYSSKRIPIIATIEHIKELKKQGAILYCWSSGGADYARNTAEELGILDIFEAFLPKPQMLLDDREINDWREIIQVHPMSCRSKSLDDYRNQLKEM